MATAKVPVLSEKTLRGWPKHETGGHVDYHDLADVLTRPFKSDAHFSSYSAPQIARRLTSDALERRDELPDGLPIVAAVFDVDADASHVATGGTAGVVAPDAWWADELAKIDALRASHPSGFAYRTRGGYRLVYRLTGTVLRDRADGEAWASRYVTSVAYLRRAFGIVADHGCHDWTRLFRAPCVVRDGRREIRETIGDASDIGMWACEPTAEDFAIAKTLRRQRKPREAKGRKPREERDAALVGDGVLVYAFKARGDLGSEIDPGKWAIRCPWASEHTKGEDFDTSTVLFAPSVGDELGWPHCSHAHCTTRDLRAWLERFTRDELVAARAAAGVDRPDQAGNPGGADAPSGRVFKLADHVEIARALVADLGGAEDAVYDELHPWKYDSARGLWTAIDRADESRIVQGYSGEPTTTMPLRVKASDVSGAIKLAHDQMARPGFFVGAPNGIAFANGFLSVSEKGAVLAPLERGNRARAAYPFAYERAALPRLFLAFLDGLFRDDEDRSEKASFVQEFFGACILGIAPVYQRCVIAEGGGDNGKSRLADIAIAGMPSGTTSAIAPQEWHQEYRRALLVGKRLNAVGELPEREILASEAFKAIVAGDPIVGRIIRESPVTFRPIAGHYFAANTLPGSPDQTEGFWRRFVVLTFNRSFKNDPTRDPKIAERIIAAERPAIVSWFIDGGVRLSETNEYTIPSSHRAALAEWRRTADQVALFVDDETRPLRADESIGWGAAAAELYGAYRRWCERNGHRPMANNNFGKRMKMLGRPSTKTNKGWHYPVAFLTVADRAHPSDTNDGQVTDYPSPN